MTGIVNALVGAECPYCHSAVEYIKSDNEEVVYGCEGCHHEWKLTEVKD